MRRRVRQGLLRLAVRPTDALFTQLALQRGRARYPENLPPEERIEKLEELLPSYEPFVKRPAEAFFPTPAKLPVVRRKRVREADGREVLDLSWPSDYEPFAAADEYRGLPGKNTIAHARWYKSPTPRPLLVLVHGYMSGFYRIEERLWPIRWYLDQGYDVALSVLPFHGARGDGFLTQPSLPHPDPRLAIEGFRHAIHDLRALIAWFRREVPSVGVMGMSLGGYTSALLATVEPGMRFVVPFIPLASIPDFARDQGRLLGSPSEQLRQYELLERVYRVVSPLARPPAVEGRLVIAGYQDRITPILHARRIAHHFDAPLELFEGGHLVQVGRNKAFEALARLMKERFK